MNGISVLITHVNCEICGCDSTTTKPEMDFICRNCRKMKDVEGNEQVLDM